jgi:hypothetical protein
LTTIIKSQLTSWQYPFINYPDPKVLQNPRFYRQNDATATQHSGLFSQFCFRKLIFFSYFFQLIIHGERNFGFVRFIKLSNWLMESSLCSISHVIVERETNYRSQLIFILMNSNHLTNNSWRNCYSFEQNLDPISVFINSWF